MNEIKCLIDGVLHGLREEFELRRIIEPTGFSLFPVTFSNSFANQLSSDELVPTKILKI